MEQPQSWSGPTGPWNSITTNSDYIFVIDNAVPEWLIKSIDEQFYRVPMEWNHYSYPGSKPFFGKTWYNQRTGQSEQAPWAVYALGDLIRHQVLPAVAGDAQFQHYVRINLNAYPRGYDGGAHVDFDDDVSLWSVLYFVNDSDGTTRFYKSPTDMTPLIDAEAKKGRILMFPACYQHQALAGTGELRMTVNYGMRIQSILNEIAYAGDRK